MRSRRAAALVAAGAVVRNLRLGERRHRRPSAVGGRCRARARRPAAVELGGHQVDEERCPPGQVSAPAGDAATSCEVCVSATRVLRRGDDALPGLPPEADGDDAGDERARSPPRVAAATSADEEQSSIRRLATRRWLAALCHRLRPPAGPHLARRRHVVAHEARSVSTKASIADLQLNARVDHGSGGAAQLIERI